MTKPYAVIGTVVLVLVLGCGSEDLPPKEDSLSVSRSVPVNHPLFKTPVLSNRSLANVSVEILQDRGDYTTRGELFLVVQSSRFPSETIILMPLSDRGVPDTYLELPFSITPGDEVSFVLVDDDYLTDDEARAVAAAARVAGYCVVQAAVIQQPSLEIAAPLSNAVIDELITPTNVKLQGNEFEYLSSARYVVPDKLPVSPYVANELTLVSETNKADAVVRVYAGRETSGRLMPASGERL